MSEPAYSFITPTYNCGRFVRRCHWSLCQQTRQDWEWIVVDDDSADDTADVVARLGDRRIRYFRMARRGGPGAARNHAMAQARGAWLVMQDMDDLSFPARLEHAERARSDGYDFMCSYLALIDSHYAVKGLRGWESSRYPRSFPHATLCGRADLLRSVGYPARRSGEDQTMVLQLANNHRGLNVPAPLYVYHENASLSVTKALGANRSMLQQLWNLRRRGMLNGSPQLYRVMALAALKVGILTVMWPFGNRAYALTLRRRENLAGPGASILAAGEQAFIQAAAAAFPGTPE